MSTCNTEESFVDITAKDLLHFVTGEFVGSGAFREVFEYTPYNNRVIKVEQCGGRFENALEFETWQTVMHTEHAKWFAPCYEISANGIWLTQARTKPIPESKLPKEVPAYFTDIKRENLGLYKGHPCFHDYGRSLLMTKGLTNRMKKIDWNEV